METYLAGLGVGLSLIVAIGAQNSYVLRQGVRRERVGIVVLICILSDLLLIGLGTAGIGGLIQGHARVLAAVTWAGAAYLVWFAIRSFRSARSRATLIPLQQRSQGRSVVGTTLAMTYLNPHVYLDTLVMLGGVAGRFGSARWAFAGGALSASTIWFVALGGGAALLAGPLGRPRTWQVLDVVVGVVVLVVALRLVSLAVA